MSRMGAICVTGLGLGYSLSLLLTDAGYKVIGIDTNPQTWERPRLDETMSAYAHLASQIHFTTSYDAVADADLCMIFVSTPLVGRRLSIANVEASLSAILAANHHAVISILSTLPIGGTAYLLDKYPEAASRLLLSPPQVRQGAFLPTFTRPPLQLIGSGHLSDSEALVAVYRDLQDRNTKYLHADYKTVEVTKLAINAFLATKIVFANSVADYCKTLGMDGSKVMRLAANDPRIGSTHPSYPTYTKPDGPYAGQCLPRDVEELLNATEEPSQLKELLGCMKALNEKRAR